MPRPDVVGRASKVRVVWLFVNADDACHRVLRSIRKIGGRFMVGRG